MRSGGQAGQRFGIDDGDPLVGQVLAAADQRPRPVVVRLGVEHFAARQRGGVEGADHRRPADVAAGDDQRGLGQPETGIKRLAAETAGGEGLGKRLAAFPPAPAPPR